MSESNNANSLLRENIVTAAATSHTSSNELNERTTSLLCTFAATGSYPTIQEIYICNTCNESSSSDAPLCICSSCAESCHEGHDVEFLAVAPAYCDCHQLVPNEKCRILDSSKKEADRLGVQPMCRGQRKTEHKCRSFDFLGWNDETCEQLRIQAQNLGKLSKDTFWVSDDIVNPCELETLALAILKFHYPLSPAHGAEWWVQVKPTGVDLHYDKDETLAESFGLGSFPYLSTVTYLTSRGGPTLIFDHYYSDPEGNEINDVWVSYPRMGKHIAFDGSLLHGAPSYFSQVGERVTFLVNIWETKPVDVMPLSDDVRESLQNGSAKVLVDDALNITEKAIIVQKLIKEHYSDKVRIEIPFVSKGATWIEDEEDSGLVMSMFAPEGNYESDTTKLELDDGVTAYLTYQEDDDEAGDCNDLR